MIFQIQTGTDNKILRQKSEKVKEITPVIKQLILDMIETVESDSNNIGLAAPQVGQSLRIIVAKPSPHNPAIVLINPEIKKKSFRKEVMEEGCLSLPDFSAPVKRPKEIIVQGLNLKDQLVKIKAQGFLARILQHEIDHLNGVLISDHQKGSAF